MNASPQAPALHMVHAYARKGMLYLCFSIFLPACSGGNSDTAMGARTFYLRNAEAVAMASARTRRGTPLPKQDSEPKPTASHQENKNAMTSAEPESEPEPRIAPPPPSIADSPEFQKLPYDQQLSKLRAELLKRIHTLSNSQADSACLILQIIPRESVFDRSIDPRAKLLNYAHQVTTVNDLVDIEKAINNPKI